MTEDELREALKKLKVEDVLLQTVATLIDLAARRMGLAEEDGEKKMDQAKLAIDAIRALNPHLTEEQQTAVREPLSQLQMAYARESAAGSGAPEAAPEPETGGVEGEDAAGAAAANAEREAARAKIWTPPGT